MPRPLFRLPEPFETIIDCHIHFQCPGGVYDQVAVDRCLRLADDAGIDRMVYLFNLGTGVSIPRRTISA